MSVRTVSVRLLAEISGYVSPMKAAVQSTKDLKTELSKAASESKLDAVASMGTKAGLALSGGFLLATTAAARFEKAMSEVDAVAGASASEMQRLSEAALQAGKDTQYSATEAANAEAELAKAGLSASDILGGALKGSMALAAAGSLDLAEAADTAAKAMNVFDLSGKDVGHVADVLAAAANKSATDVHELAFALKMGGLAAKNSGVSLEETVGTFAAFADNALVGSDAGTSFKQMLMMLQAPSDKAAGLMQELGVSAYDAKGNFIGIAGLADVLRLKLAGLTQEQRNEALATIFGSDAMRAATVLYDEGGQGIRDYTAAVNDQGAAAETARKKTDNLMGDIERLTGSLETLFIQAGTGSNSGLRFLAQDLGHLVDMVTSLPAPVLSLGTILLGLGGVGLLALSAFVKVRGAVADMAEEMRNAGPVMGRVGSGLELTTKWAGRAAVAMAALHVASMAASAIFGSDLNPQIKALNTDLIEFGRTGKASGEMARLFGSDSKKLATALDNATSSGRGFSLWMESLIPGAADADRSWTKNIDRVNAMDQALAELASSGHADEAAAVFKRLWTEAQAQGKTLEELQGAFPAYVAAAAEAAKATAGHGNATADTTDKQLKLNDSLQDSINKGHSLMDVWAGLHGSMQTADGSLLAAKKSIEDVGKSFDEHGRKVQGSSIAVLENRTAMEKAAEKAVEAAQAYYDLHVATDGQASALAGATRLLDGLKAEMIKSTGATGDNRTQVQGLANDLYKLPANVPVAVSVTTTYRSIGKPPPVSAAVLRESYAAGEVRNRWGGAYTHAAAGVLREASTFSPVSPARYAFAEPATGGEAFVPKRGDYARSMSILSEAAGWYGAQVVPQQGWYGSAGTPAVASSTSTGIDYMKLGRAVASAMRQSPMTGVVTLDGRAVGAIQGQQADIYTRGG